MVVLSAGSFTMGSPSGEPGRYDQEGPQRRVSIRRFAVGMLDLERFAGHVRWLSHRTGRKYRLLTEAEWEYAARAGTTTSSPWGSSASHDFANYGADACCSGGRLGPRSMGQHLTCWLIPAERVRLYDMHGNILQWVQDCFASSYSGLPTDSSAYEVAVPLKLSGSLSDMTGTGSCSYRMLRGDDWGDPTAQIRSVFRNFAPPPGATLPEYRSAGVGFRVARTLD